MSEQRKNTGTRKRATKKDTENKTTRTQKKGCRRAGRARPTEQGSRRRIVWRKKWRKPQMCRNRWQENRSMTAQKPERTPPAAASFEVARVLKVTKPLMRGDDVKALQTALIERNYHCGVNGADGTYGRLTAYAVRCFQASKGLIVNGRADRYTIAALGGTWKE